MAQGGVVLRFDNLDIQTSNTTIAIYYADSPTGTPAMTITAATENSVWGNTAVHNGPVTIQFTKTTTGGDGTFNIGIKYHTGDQVITWCYNNQVAVWTDFMQPDSYTFVDEIQVSYTSGAGSPICVGYFDSDRNFVSSEMSLCIDPDREIPSVVAGN